MEQDKDTVSAKRNKYIFPLIVLAVCLALGGYILWNQYGGSKYQQGADFSLTDTEGKNVTLQNTNGQVRLLYFFFANCPDVCPPTTSLVSQAQEQMKQQGLFGSKVQFLWVTIDPTHDTPDRLKAYANQFNVDFTGWKFLRGDEKATASVAEKYGAPVYKDADGNYGHMNLIMLLDKKGRIREWISASDYYANGKKNKPVSDIVGKIKDLL